MKLFEKPQKSGTHPLDIQLAAGLRGDFKTGWEMSQLLERQSPACNRAAFNRAWYHMMRGDLLLGLSCLDQGRWIQVFGDQPLPTDKPIFHGENIQNKNLLLCSEGGLGDEIINVRFAQDLAQRGAKVTVTCDPSLASVFARVPGVVSVVGHRRSPNVFHDFWVPAMSAAHVLGCEYQDISGKPYLSVHPEYDAKWKRVFAQKYGGNSPKIGLRFYGNPKFEHEQHRRFPQELMINALEGRPWVNLQKEESDLDLETWEDTLAVIHQLDLVITSCTSVAHASAAMGKETWVLLPILPYYIWALPGKKSPWYDSVSLFRQRHYGVWDNPFRDVCERLKTRMPIPT